MISAIMKKEAKARAEKHAQEAKLRAVVASKKAELEALSAPELKKQCSAAGLTGSLSKQERVKQLLAQWAAEDGISKALAQQARSARGRSWRQWKRMTS